MLKHDGAHVQVRSKDSGYTNVCHVCGKRGGNKREMIGKERYLDIILCAVCFEKPRSALSYREGKLLKGPK